MENGTHVTITEVAERFLVAFSAMEKAVVFVAWSSKLASTESVMMASSIMDKIDKAASPGFVSVDANGHGLIFEHVKSTNRMMFCGDGTISYVNRPSTRWRQNEDNTRDMSYKRAAAMMDLLQKTSPKRPCLFLMFSNGELGDVSKWMMDRAGSLSHVMCVNLNFELKNGVISTSLAMLGWQTS